VKQEVSEDETYIEQEPEVIVKVEAEDNIVVEEHGLSVKQEYLQEHTR
jgi:hypothetical protein